MTNAGNLFSRVFALLFATPLLLSAQYQCINVTGMDPGPVLYINGVITHFPPAAVSATVKVPLGSPAVGKYLVYEGIDAFTLTYGGTTYQHNALDQGAWTGTNASPGIVGTVWTGVALMLDKSSKI